MIPFVPGFAVLFEKPRAISDCAVDDWFQMCFAFALGDVVFMRRTRETSVLVDKFKSLGFISDTSRVELVEDWTDALCHARRGGLTLVAASAQDALSGLSERWGIAHAPIPPRPEAWSAPHLAHLRTPRVAILGAESTGKTTLCADLSRSSGMLPVTEYVRFYLDQMGRSTTSVDEIPLLITGQIALETAIHLGASKGVICDTEPRQTLVWSELLFGTIDPMVRQIVLERRYHGVLLTAPDIEWRADPQRCFPEGGAVFTKKLQALLAESDVATISGMGAERTAVAEAALHKIVTG